jgi:hypothetical protein
MPKSNFRDKVCRLLEGVGLPARNVVFERYDPDAFGNGEVIVDADAMRLRFIRERGQDFLEIGPSEGDENFLFDDVELAMGWKTHEEVFSRLEPEPLSRVVEKLSAHWLELANAFLPPAQAETVNCIRSASGRRGEAYVAHLRELAESARKS